MRWNWLNSRIISAWLFSIVLQKYSEYRLLESLMDIILDKCCEFFNTIQMDYLSIQTIHCEKVIEWQDKKMCLAAKNIWCSIYYTITAVVSSVLDIYLVSHCTTAIAIGRGHKNHTNVKFHDSFIYQIQYGKFQPEIETQIC